MLEKQQKRYRCHKRVRAKVFGTTRRPRLCVFKSNKHIYAQLIDDEKAETLITVSDSELKSSKLVRQLADQSSKPQLKTKNLKEKKEGVIRTSKVAIAHNVGKLLAEKTIKEKIKEVVFDRGGYKYHGRVKALAEGAREGGLKF